MLIAGLITKLKIRSLPVIVARIVVRHLNDDFSSLNKIFLGYSQPYNQGNALRRSELRAHRYATPHCALRASSITARTPAPTPQSP